jgi:hypothetical protein
MSTQAILVVAFATSVLALYFLALAYTIATIWRSPNASWWVSAAWTLLVVATPLVGVIAWFTIGERVNEEVRRTIDGDVLGTVWRRRSRLGISGR